MKLTLMLMGGSALLVVGLLGIYFFNGKYSGTYTFELTAIAAAHAIPGWIQNIFFPFIFIGFGVLGALFPFHTWSPDGHASAPTAVSMLHAGVLMKLGTTIRLSDAVTDAATNWATLSLSASATLTFSKNKSTSTS